MVLARRDAMEPAARAEASRVIAAAADAVLDVRPGTVVSGFLPIRSELDPRPLMAALAVRGARICVPAIVDGRLEFRELRAETEMEPQGFGTYAPGTAAAVLDPAIMLVPMVAFDARCHRMGYGRGYYDGAIAALQAKGMIPVLAGLALAVQEVPDVPTEPHDVALDFIVTERMIYRRA
jgi:5-formyltetrahydrofolate cyclo-ligase